jgi:hypothetical protein
MQFLPLELGLPMNSLLKTPPDEHINQLYPILAFMSINAENALAPEGE